MSARRFKFTYAALAKLPTPTKGWVYHYDTVVPSLALGIGASGARTFVIIKMIAGRQERIKLDRMSDSFGIDAARQAASAQLIALASGVNPADARRATRDGMTLREAFDDFKELRRSRKGGFLSEKTKRGYTSDFNHLKTLASRTLGSIGQQELVAIHSRLGKAHPHAANRILSLASGIYSHADERKFYAGTNPARGIKKFPEASRERFLRPDEVKRFMDALAATEQPWRNVFALLAFTSVRKTGVLSVRWSDVDLTQRIWNVANAKGGRYTIPLSDNAVAIFEQIPRVAGADYIFPSRKGSENPHLTEPKKAWNDLVYRAKLAERLTLHDLRRTLPSWAAANGTSLQIIGKSLGHRSAQSTEVYARLTLEPVRDSVAGASGAFLSHAKGNGSAAALRKIFGQRKRST